MISRPFLGERFDQPGHVVPGAGGEPALEGRRADAHHRLTPRLALESGWNENGDATRAPLDESRPVSLTRLRGSQVSARSAPPSPSPDSMSWDGRGAVSYAGDPSARGRGSGLR